MKFGHHMSALASSGWGTACEAEKVQRTFLRKAFGGMPASATGDVILFKSGCTPLLHAWVSRLVGWYNRVIARSDDDIVKIPIIFNRLTIWLKKGYQRMRVIKTDAGAGAII